MNISTFLKKIQEAHVRPLLKKTHLSKLTDLNSHLNFATVDHATIPNRLSNWYGISTYGQDQIWFSSYLENRHQSVKIKYSLSDNVTLSYGVPRRSVLGPVLFILYTTPLSTIISSFDINHHLYENDTQIFMNLLRSCNIV